MSKRRRKRNQRNNKDAPAESDAAAPGDAPSDADTPASAPDPAEAAAADAARAAADAVAAAENASSGADNSDDGETVPAAALREAEKERDEYLALAQKARADLENYRRRAARDAEAQVTQARADILGEILNPVDDLDRALEAAGRERNFDSLFEGLELVRKSLWKGLEKHGFARIVAEHGDPFDPNVHEAMMKTPHPEVPENRIIEEITPGYRLGDRVLRAARVMVSAGPEADS